MKKHKWIGNTCVKCGLLRERKTQSTLMAVVNHPPWEAWLHETKFRYYNGFEWSWQRPDCKSNDNSEPKAIQPQR